MPSISSSFDVLALYELLFDIQTESLLSSGTYCKLEHQYDGPHVHSFAPNKLVRCCTKAGLANTRVPKF